MHFHSVAEILSIMTKLNTIIRSECTSTWKFPLILENKLKKDGDSSMKKQLSLNEYPLFCDHSSGFGILSISASNNNDLKSTL